MRQRQSKPRPLFRQEFSDWMYQQERWTQNVQDQYLSWLTAPLYEALTNGELCADSYDPYNHLHRAIKLNKSKMEARIILQEVEEILCTAINDTEPESEYWNMLNNWLTAWEIYSEYLETEVFTKILNKKRNN